MKLKVAFTKPNPKNYDKDVLLGLYKSMKEQRVFDESINRFIAAGKIKGFYHNGSGQEGVSAGTLCQLRDDDGLFYCHRGCNDMIAKGTPISMLYGDFFSNVHGTNKGLGAGIVHSAWPPKGVLGQPGTVGSNVTLAVGVAYAYKVRKVDNVVVCVFGDGSSARELLHGALNWAGLWKLPVIFVCQNNQYAIVQHYMEDHAVEEHIAEYAEPYRNVQPVVVDGNDVLAVHEVMATAVARARAGEGATFIEAKTFRHFGHSVGDTGFYMDAERRDWFTNFYDPIKNFAKQLIEFEIATAEDLAAIDAEVVEADSKASALADTFPLPPESRLYEGLFSEGNEVLK